uniref:hypothetical protein n=1 Tax=uncultured Bradyrhizobium sp. TaxID=199684 RepID=UPI0026107577
RGRHFRLWGAVGGLRELESGNHNVTYVVGADEDDPDTINVCELMKMDGRFAYGIFRRTGSLGAMDNTLARMVPGDAYCVLADDLAITAKDWDQKIADAWEAEPKGVYWWKCKTNPPSLAPIVSHAWFEAAGYLFTDYFPFWWDDLWLMELWLLAAEAPPIYVDAYMRDTPVHTHRLRDLRFWSDFYQNRKPERIAEAKRIAAALGWKLTGITEDLSKTIMAAPNPAFLAQIPQIERQGDTGQPPTPEYLKAKARAESLMAPPATAAPGWATVPA